MIRDLRLTGLEEKTSKEYLRAVRQLAAYYMIRPDQLSERQVEDYLLYVRDELGIARGTFAPLLAGLKFFYVNTLGYDWPLLTTGTLQNPRFEFVSRPAALGKNPLNNLRLFHPGQSLVEALEWEAQLAIVDA